MYHVETRERPDRLMPHHHIFSTSTNKWEPVKSSHWSEDEQVYVVSLGATGAIVHTYYPGFRVVARRFY